VLRVILILLGCMACTFGMGQISMSHKQQILSVSELPIQLMPALQNQDLVFQEETRRKSSDTAAKFAYPFSVDYDIQKSGTWESVGDHSIWRLVIESEGAHSLNLGFNKFHLPPTAKLYIYDYFGGERLRPFLPADNEEHEQLWAPLIASDKIVIEVNVKSKEVDDVQLVLNYVNHDFMDVQKSISGACHIDVSCGSSTGYPGVDDFRDQIRSIGLYTIQGVSICTGFLVNNTKQDCRPYFMTANHCNLNADNAPSMVTYWNYENSYCREPGSYNSAEDGDGVLSQFNTGAILRSTWSPSDFTLVEMDDEIPEQVNPYFCGWDISNNLPSRGVVIHHPNLEEKRISFKYSSLYLGEWGQQANPIVNGNHLIVDAWDLGSTEDGSSGGPLFNRQGLVVGQLHGGLATCGNEEYDAFGRLYSSWTGGGTKETRLRDWLDPESLGVLSLSGVNCVFNIELSDNNFTKCNADGYFEIAVGVSESFQGAVELTFEGLPNGAFAFFEQTTIQSNENTKLIVSNLEELAAGSYTIHIVARDQVQTVKVELNFHILSEVSAAPALLFPEQRSMIDISESLLLWDGDPTTNIYKLQIARDEDFTDVLIDQVLSGNSYDASNTFAANQAYFYRVKSINICGESEWSTIYQFLTVNLFCINEQDVEAQEISQGEPSIIYASIANEIEGKVLSVKVDNISGVHSFVSDLRFSLISPEGTEVQLIRDKCAFTQDFDFGFSDEGVADIVCPLTNETVYQPLQALSTFRGESALGEWTLKVEDKNMFDGGMLESWSIEICVNSSDDFSLTGTIDTLNMCTNETFNLPLSLGAGFDTDSNLMFESSDPNITRITATTSGVHLVINPDANAAPGHYPITLQVIDMFDNTASYELDITILDQPSIFDLIEPVDQTILENQNLNLNWLNSTYAENYMVSVHLNESLSSEIFRDTINDTNYVLPDIFTADQVYYWQVTATNRCGQRSSETRSFTLEQSNNTESVTDLGVHIYPNPTKEFIHIQDLSKSLDKVKLHIQSIDGRVVYKNEIEFGADIHSIPISNWTAGMYIISIFDERRTQISRIVVQ
jgi:subtilisin-like proprotein convertase family protein